MTATIIQRLWDGLPTIQALIASGEVEAKNESTVTESEALQLVTCLFKACHGNATPADAKNSAESLVKGDAARNFAWLSEFVENVVMKQWIDQSFKDVLPAGVKAAPQDEEGTVPLTEVQEQLKSVVDCVLDDREPNALLAVDAVLTVPNKPKSLLDPIAVFVSLQEYPQYAPVYYRMWDLAKPTTQDSITSIDIESFVSWFTCLYRVQFANATPSRARVAAKALWNEILEYRLPTAMILEDFMEAARRFAGRYAKVEPHNVEAYFQKIVTFVEELLAASPNTSSNFFDTPIPADVEGPVQKLLLVDAKQVHEVDDFDADRCESAYFKRPTTNRVLVLGRNGIAQKDAIARAIAARLGAVYVDVFEAAVAAVDASLDDKNTNASVKELGRAIRTATDTGDRVTLDVRAALVRGVLQRSATLHRGFVFADIPSTKAPELNAYFESCGFTTLDGTLPQGVVTLQCIASVSKELTEASAAAAQAIRDTDLARRRDEQAAIEEKAAAKAAREAKRAARAARAERKARIEAGEEAAPTEENPLEPEDEQEDIEEPAEVDEEGNPLDAEAVLARDALRAKDRSRRILLEDIRHALMTDVVGDVCDVESLPSISPVLDACRTNRRVAQVSIASSAEDAATFVQAFLRLTPSTIPVEVPLPEDATENPDGSADNDLAIADAKLRAVTESGRYSFSKWRKYCPVTYTERRVLIEGSMAYSVTYRGRIYCFASPQALKLFTDFPHTYLNQHVTGVAPILLLKRTLDVFGKSTLTPSLVQADLAERLGLTSYELPRFLEVYEKQRTLEQSRVAAQATRLTADTKQRVAREDRLKKRLEAEAKKKKKETEKKKPAKKKDDDVADGGDEAPAEAGEAQEVVIVETTGERSLKAILAELDRRKTFCPLLVNALDTLDETAFNTLFDGRVLPPTVVVLDYEEPRPEGEEEAAEDEAEEEAPVEEDAEELDEDGNPKPKPPPKPKIFDPTDDKQYRRLTKKLLEKITQSTEASGTEPEPAEEGKPAPKPYQAFNVTTINVFQRSHDALIADIVLAVHPLSVGALAPQDGEDISADPEPEEGDTRNPLLIPGPKAIHQFGSTLRYCPVSLRDRGVLVVGDSSYWMSFRGKKYMFASAEAMAAFKRNPYPYAVDVKVSVAPRIWVVGVPFAGKRTVTERLAEQYNMPIFTLDDAFLYELIAATKSNEGATVRGTFVPPSTNEFAVRAANTADSLRKFDDDQRQQQELKEKVQREQTEREERRDAGEEVEDLDEEDEADIQKALEFEAEEAEARDERVSKAMRQIAAALTRIEPFESSGYLLAGRPNTEAEMQGLLDEGAIPDIVIHLKVGTDVYVARQIDGVYAKRKEEQEAKQLAVDEKKKAILVKARHVELKKWRRRNIGADDPAEEGDEAEEAPEDVEPVTVDAVRSDLEGQYDTENGNVGAVVGGLPDRRIPVSEVNGDVGKEQVYMQIQEVLERILVPVRRSLFQAVEVCTFNEAIALTAAGAKVMSSFRFVDPVQLADERGGKPDTLVMKLSGSVVTGEEEIPELPPPPPKEKRYRTVTKTNDDGEEVEVQEEEPEEEEPVEEPEPEEPLEPEPELSPEELDEMRKEHLDKLQVKAASRQRKAAILGHRVYFFDNDVNLLRFIRNPLAFWDQPPPLPPADALVVSSMEAPPATQGETKPRSMGEHLAANTKAVFINLPKLLQWSILNESSLGHLAVEAKAALVGGIAPSDDCIGSLLQCRLWSADIRQRGAVIENLPRSTDQVSRLFESSIRISKCFTFQEPVLNDSVEAIRERTSTVHAVKEEPYTMASLREMVGAVKQSENQQREHVLRTTLAFPAPTYHTPVLEANLEAHRSQYQWYCPYMWSRHQQLVEDPASRTLITEYLGRYFCLSSESFFKEFMVHPELVSGESLAYGVGETQTEKLELPRVLPTHVHAAEAEQLAGNIAIELAGCCPVTLHDTRFNLGLRGITEPTAVKGDASNFLVRYDSKYYAVLNEEKTERFLRQPWVFAKHAVLPPAVKLPFDPASLKEATNELYITRTMREAAARAMLAVCRQRPKYPGLTLEESALKFMALYIKAHNSSNSDIATQQYRHNFEQFQTEATLYKTIKTEAPDDAEGQKAFHSLCHAWDRVQDDPQGFRNYVHLQQNHEASFANQE